MKQNFLYALVVTTISCGQPKVDKKAEGEKVVQLAVPRSQPVFICPGFTFPLTVLDHFLCYICGS